MVVERPAFRRAARELAEAVRFLAARGWTPATSSNFSSRVEGEGLEIEKGLAGVTTHEHAVLLPILPNSQD
jgi:ribulose-5-phosphate 4-epimerase/fuculose-1-phosphate aldolase